LDPTNHTAVNGETLVGRVLLTDGCLVSLGPGNRLILTVNIPSELMEDNDVIYWKDSENYEISLGLRTFADGRQYMGHFKKSKRHGFGTIVEASGRYYQSFWVNDVKSKGKMTWSGTLNMQVRSALPFLLFSAGQLSLLECAGRLEVSERGGARCFQIEVRAGAMMPRGLGATRRCHS
jgi:hypothetical protein